MDFEINESVLEVVKGWAVEAGQMARAWQRKAVGRMKADKTPVTNSDVQVEQFLVSKIRAAFPDHQVIGEEAGRVGPDSAWVWAVDPIDGTKSYLRQLPVWCVCVGLLHHGKPAAGVINIPVSGDLYWGWQGTETGGAYCNGKPLGPDPQRAYDDSMYFLAVHSVAHREYNIRYPRIQAFGSTAAHLAYVADGRAVGALIRQVNLWDLAAALPILYQAGYAAEFLSGEAIDLSVLADGRKTSEEIIATRPEWMQRLRDQIR